MLSRLFPKKSQVESPAEAVSHIIRDHVFSSCYNIAVCVKRLSSVVFGGNFEFRKGF